jgi:hypothetical protein
MGKAIDAINAGLIYQNLYFWMFASELLHKESNIKKMSYEDDRVKSIDDVVVEYIEAITGFMVLMMKLGWISTRLNIMLRIRIRLNC